MELDGASKNDIKRKLGGKVFISCNMNSLNLSSSQSFYKTTMLDKKIDYVLNKCPDFVLLQDIRLGTKAHIFEDKIRCTKYGNFHAFLNSSKDSRGVAILINSKVNYVVHNCYKSMDENYLIMDLSVDNFRFTLCSVYGPRYCENNAFFDGLRSSIRDFKNKNFLIMGDLNLVTCPLQTTGNQNIDLFNAKDIPNKQNSLKIIDWINSGNIVDCFRSKYPDKKEYSYIPFSNKSLYKSRLDHVLSDCDLNDCIANISYATPLKNVLDHKMIYISFKKHTPAPPSIDNNYLDAPGLEELVHTTTYNSLSDYCNLELDQVILQNLRFICFSITEISKMRQVLPNDKLLVILCDNQINHFHHIKSLLPEYSQIIEHGLSIPYTLFLRTLVNNLTLELSQYQLTLKKFANYSKKLILDELKNCHDPEQEKELISQIENIENDELLRRCKSSKLWETCNLEKPSKSFCSLSKSKNNSSDISVVKKHDLFGNVFELDDNSRAEYVNKFFQDIYSLPKISSTSIEEFLGNDILNLADVQKKKTYYG